jgi:flagellar biosynthesis protein FlhF
MELITFRASSMQEALAMVRHELGPDAAVLHTREVQPPRLLRWLNRRRQIEVTASTQVNVPSRLKEDDFLPEEMNPTGTSTRDARGMPPARPGSMFDSFSHDQLRDQLSDLHDLVADLHRNRTDRGEEMPAELFQVYTDLIDADVSDDLARELIERLNHEASPGIVADPPRAKEILAGMIRSEIHVADPIQVRSGHRHLVALVGPTGVGKTTTIAKMAANFRLREKRRVGLITVDTYRIAAVEQLRTYADIIDLPMRVVSTPREMRQAIQSFADLDLVLMDTAGRSPRDDVKIHELRSFLNEAGPDEVHLVLSSVSGANNLRRTAEEFSVVGTTRLILTKLDEATGLGNLLPLLRGCGLPLSYLTDGQNVPDDIAAASADRLARDILGLKSKRHV